MTVTQQLGSYQAIGRFHARAVARLRRLAYLGIAGAVALIAGATFSCASASALPVPVGCAAVPNQVFLFYCYQRTYQYKELNDPADTTFNQLLGINQAGVIAGYFGSGVPVGNAGHPNQGYLLFPPYFQNYYASNNYAAPPTQALQTQVTGVNNNGILVGFYSRMNNAGNMGNDNHGWYKAHGQFFQADFPTTTPASPPVDQLLGVNDGNVAVGFYTDATGVNHGYTYNIGNGQATAFNDPTGFTNVTASGINDSGDISGFGTTTGPDGKSITDGFLTLAGGATTTIAYPNATTTQALGVNNSDEVVGVYTDAANLIHGFTWNARTNAFATVDAPFVTPGTTTINGVDACGDLVGFYVDGAGNTDGLLATAVYNKNQFTIFNANPRGRQFVRGLDARLATSAAKKINPKTLKYNLLAGC